MKLVACLLATASLTFGLSVHAQDANLKKTLTERIPQLEKIDEVRSTPMSGLYEVRVGTDIFYTDAKGNYLIQGELIDTKARRNLTEDRMTQLTAVDFKQLPIKDAITIVHGKGERKMAVFEDPNCGYCKRFEKTCRAWTTSPSTSSSTPS
jgi:thiol:disulfide interchange protein DsbC